MTNLIDELELIKKRLDKIENNQINETRLSKIENFIEKHLGYIPDPKRKQKVKLNEK